VVKGEEMAIVCQTAMDIKPGRWDDAQKSLKAGNELQRKHGAENVTTMVTMLAGPNTGTVTTLWSAPDWESFGKVFNAIMADPEILALMASSTAADGPTSGWSTYVSQTIPDM
jgi:hypothetical protein